MLAVVVQFLLLALVVVVAGAALAWCADQIAEITRLGHVLVGSVLLAAATSLPELTVDLTSIRLGKPDLAAGDLLGSCLINLLILAVIDLVYLARGKMLSREAASHALSGVMSMTLAAFVGMALVIGGRFGTQSLFNISLPSGMILAAYVLGVRMVFLDRRVSARAAADAALAHGAPPPQPTGPLWKPALGFVAAAAVLFIVGPRLSQTAATLAEITGLGTSFVGTTLVAVCTSLPELVASIAAVRMRAFDLAIGNIFGSNAFNMLLFVALDAAHDGPLFAAISDAHLVSCVATIIATAIVVMGQLYQVEKRIILLEPDAALAIAVILSSLYLVYRFS